MEILEISSSPLYAGEPCDVDICDKTQNFFSIEFKRNSFGGVDFGARRQRVSEMFKILSIFLGLLVPSFDLENCAAVCCSLRDLLTDPLVNFASLASWGNNWARFCSSGPFSPGKYVKYVGNVRKGIL